MNNNSSGRLTPKQQELVKRLEKIRQDKEVIRQEVAQEIPKNVTQESPSRNRRRNEDAQRKRNTQRKESTFARPKVEQKVPADFSESRITQRQRRQPPVQQIKRKPAVREKNNRYTTQLANGHSLAQAIVLSEILDKPVALRRR